MIKKQKSFLGLIFFVALLGGCQFYSTSVGRLDVDSVRSNSGYFDYICVGASAAGVSAAEAIRKKDSQGSIALITGEKEIPYNKCELSSYISNEKQLADLYILTPDNAQKKGIVLIEGEMVVDVDTRDKTITCQGGRLIRYGKLFLGTGSSAVSLGIQKDSLKKIPGNVFSYYTLADALSINNFIKTKGARTVLVVGTGINGLEVASAFHKRGMNITLIGRGDLILRSYVDAGGSAFIEKNLQLVSGLSYRKRTVIDFFDGDAVVLNENGEKKKEYFDLIIFTTGVEKNLLLAEKAGLEIKDEGVVVNEAMQTSNPNIFAGGDIVRVKNKLTDQWITPSKWSDSKQQGAVAGAHMVNQNAKEKYEGYIPARVSEFFGIKMLMCGSSDQDSVEYQKSTQENKTSYLMVALDAKGVLKRSVYLSKDRSLMLSFKLRRAMLNQAPTSLKAFENSL